MNAPPQRAVRHDTPHSDHAQCVVSKRLDCIFIAIAKNASSTIRAVLRAADNDWGDLRCHEIPPETWRSNTVFTFLRDPVARAVSAYHEVSIRLDEGLIAPLPFQILPAGEERFDAFLDCVEAKPFDEHVRSQADLIGDHRIDFWGNFDFLRRDLEDLFGRLEWAISGEIPHLRRRRVGRRDHRYPRGAADLSAATVERIRRIYRRDFELIAAMGVSGDRADRAQERAESQREKWRRPVVRASRPEP